ncbi:hypothetical protein GDO86_012100 [Hymenochirus boettgeri]|uniref:Saposin B-type domain-containing protein n=1 Tax=Hymenochirus boettgeri TaxID=247094 RepID=A0A8T2JE16_9PIPI|nr:hypothetical protein GDO86_012100 [Hymenochirus boettgeri]
MEVIRLHFGIMVAAFLICHVEGKRDPVLYCGACRALVEELYYEIRKIDPKKMVVVPLAKSELYLTEVLENVCEKMNDYGLYVDPSTQEKSYRRFAPRDNEGIGSVDFKNFKFNPEESNTLKYACERVVEEHEDEVISVITKEAENLTNKLCTEKTGLCKEFLHGEL